MPYLVADDLPRQPAGERFRAALAAGGILRLPGTHNGLAAAQARAAGFQACYLSGAAMTASMGLPDLGIITIEEVSFFIRQVSRASGLPVLVDGDTGYGEALNVMNMVRCFEDAGAAAVHIEDQRLANMTEFGRTPFFTADEFEAMGYRMVIWPVSSLRVSARATERLYQAIAADGGAHNQIERMQTRQELYAAIGYADYEALDASIMSTILP